MTRSVKPAHEKNDRLFVYIAMTMWPGLSNGARMVGGAILYHYNWKTGQCDPSLDRLAGMTGLDRKTVTNAIRELTCSAVKLFVRVRHGGKGRRTAYFPNFEALRDFVADLNERMKTGAAPAKTAKIARQEIRQSIDEQMQNKGQENETGARDQQGKILPSNSGKNSPPTVENTPPKPIETTNRNNLLNKNVSEDKPETISKRENPEKQGEPGGKSDVQRSARPAISSRGFGLSSNIAADESANQRWVADLTRTGLLEKLIPDIDDELAIRATAAERSCRGTGAKLIVDALRGT